MKSLHTYLVEQDLVNVTVTTEVVFAASARFPIVLATNKGVIEQRDANSCKEGNAVERWIFLVSCVKGADVPQIQIKSLKYYNAAALLASTHTFQIFWL